MRDPKVRGAAAGGVGGREHAELRNLRNLLATRNDGGIPLTYTASSSNVVIHVEGDLYAEVVDSKAKRTPFRQFPSLDTMFGILTTRS